MRNRLIIIWAVFRLPLLVLLIIPFIPRIATNIENRFVGEAKLYIRYASTIPLRLQIGLIYVLLIIGFYLLVKAIHRKNALRINPLIPTMIFIILVFLVLMFFLSSSAYFYQVLLLMFVFLPLNLALPEERYSVLIGGKSGRRISDIFFSVVVIISEILLFYPFSLWLKQKTEQQNYLKNNPYHLITHPSARIVLSVLISSFFLLFSLGTKQLIVLGARLFSDPDLKVVIWGDYNGLELDKTNNTLFVSGHDTDHILAFNVNDLDLPPRSSTDTTGYTQSFAYNSAKEEIYYYDHSTSRLVILDSNNLSPKESYIIPPLSPGDVWVAWDKFTNQVVVASEADNRRKDVPMVVVDRQTGNFDQSLEQTSNILLDPDKPIVYLASFRRTNELRMYDLITHSVIKRITTDSRSNRMVLDPKRNELLIASPYKSAVLRYDKDTLEYKGKIKTMFGVRSLALDPERDLLLTGGLVTNIIDVIDLDTHTRINRIYTGPWARTIVLDTENGYAYASTIEKVVRFHYLD